MLYLNNFFPVRVYYSIALDMYRLQAPRADTDTVIFDEDFLSKKLPSSFTLLQTIYVINPRIFPPVPLGTSMFSVFQNDHSPYETKYIDWVAFPIMSNVQTSNGNFSFFGFTTRPSTDSLAMYIANEEFKCRVMLNQTTIEQYFLTTPFYAKVLDRDNFVLYVHSQAMLYWRGTTECLCVPSNNPSDYATLVECQRQVYPLVRNRKSFTGNSAIPLAVMRAQLFPEPRSVIIMPYVMIFLTLVIAIVYGILQYQYSKEKKSLVVMMTRPSSSSNRTVMMIKKKPVIAAVAKNTRRNQFLI